MVALAAAIAFLTRLPSDGPGAADVAALPGLHQAVLTWTSTAPYTDRVELSSADSPTRLVTGSSEASTRHRLVLPGLAPATDYRFQLLLPDGTRSLEYRFRTANPGISVDDLVAEEKGWRIAFTTSSPVVAYLRGDKPTPALPRLSVTHTLTLPDFDPERPGFELVLEYASGETVAVGGREVLEQLRRTFVPKLAGELARPLEALEVARFVRERIDKRLPVRVITPNKAYLDGDGLDEHWTPSGFRKRGHVRKYSPFPESDSEARALGEEMRNWFSGQRLHPRLAPLLKAGQGLLDGQPQLQPDVLASLVEGLSRCRDAEHYAAILRIPFRMGATELFGRDYRVQYRPSLPPGALRHEHAIPEGQIFACPYGDYQSLSVLATVADWKRLGPQRFTPRLEGVSRARRAEITLTRVWQLMEQRFIVRVNGRLKLRFQNDPAVYLQDRNERWPTLSQTFDPVFLREGANDISVEMELIPGTRTTAVKNGYLGSVRISLQ
ncbi:MAG: fibronectin type III domain-containing protein [Candidatus Wallbacteria bacterium]|nr:fibronectin type III domain-containing protein [Candidatus Wallbacteria bacterium]